MVNKLGNKNQNKKNQLKLNHKYTKVLDKLFKIMAEVLWEKKSNNNIPSEVIRVFLQVSIAWINKVSKKEALDTLKNHIEPFPWFFEVVIDKCSKASVFKKWININDLISDFNQKLDITYMEERTKELTETFKLNWIENLASSVVNSFIDAKNKKNKYNIAIYIHNDIITWSIDNTKWYIWDISLRSNEEILWLINKHLNHFINEYNKDYWVFSEVCEKILIVNDKQLIDIHREQTLIRLSTALLEEELEETFKNEDFQNLEEENKEELREIIETVTIYLNNIVQNDTLKDLYDGFKVEKWVIKIYITWKRTEKRPYIKAIEDPNFKKYISSIKEQTWYQIRFDFI